MCEVQTTDRTLAAKALPESAPSGDRAQPAPLQAGDWIVVTDRRSHKHMFRLKARQRFHFAGGFIDADGLIGQADGVRVTSSQGDQLAVFKATLEEYVVMMKRAAQIITPKDMAVLVQWADIYPGATVVEAGLGSGALTLGLLRAVGEAGRVIAFELREEFANCGRKNVANWSEALGQRLDVRLGDVHQELQTLSGVDRIVLDLAEPWLALPGAVAALRSGGILVAYVPTVRQVDRLVLTALDERRFSDPEVIETWLRPWHADHVRLRPVSRMCAHTGFLIRMRTMAEARPMASSDWRAAQSSASSSTLSDAQSGVGPMNSLSNTVA